MQKQPPSRYARHDQCEGQLLSFIDELSETLYNTPEDKTHYPAVAGASGSSSSSLPSAAATSAKKSANVVELGEDGRPAEGEAERQAAAAAAAAPEGTPVIKKFEIPETDIEKVLTTLMAARPDHFSKLQQFTKAVAKVMAASDEEASKAKAEGNKAFIAYQNEVASWGASPDARQKATAHRAWESAFNHYTNAIAVAKSDEFLATVLNNRSTVLFAGKQYRDAALDCNYCLKLSPSYAKALQRRAACMAKLGYEAIAAPDEAHATVLAAVASEKKDADADEKAPYDLRFALHDTLLHAFQNVTNYADLSDDDEEEGGGKKKAPKGPNPRVLSAATRLSAPSTILKLTNEDITVDRDAKRGRFVATKRQLPAGHTVLVETPYAAANYAQSAAKACALCLRPTRMLYPCGEQRARGARGRGMFCGSECAQMAWELYGARECGNVFYAVCPIDALLASRVLHRKAAKAAVLIPARPKTEAVATEAAVAADNKEGNTAVPAPVAANGIEVVTKDPLTTVAALLTLALAPEERAHVAIDPVGDNKFGKDHMDTLCAFSAELFPGLAEAGGRETILTAVAQFYSVFRDAPLTGRDIDALLTDQQKQTAEHIIDARPASDAERAAAEQFRKILRQATVNAFPIHFQDRVFSTGGETHDIANVPLGKAMYAVASLFNHSCDPNCVAAFAGQPYGASGQIHIKTIRPVQEGEELTIAYAGAPPAAAPIDKFHLHSTRARIRELRARYGFACVCGACYTEVDEPIPKEKEQFYHKASDYYQKGRRLMREGNFGESVTVLLQSYEIVMRYICPPPAPPQWMLVNTHEALAQSYNLLGNKRKVVEHLKAALSLALQLYDRHATQIAVNLGAAALEGGDHQSLNNTKEEGGAGAAEGEEGKEKVHHPRNHQADRPTGIVPGIPSPLALSASFLTHEAIQCHANKDILQSFVRLAHMNAAVGRAEEEQHRVAAEAAAKKAVEGGEGGSESSPFVSTYTIDARRFAQRSIDLMRKFYPDSAALDAELLELELVARK